jgi:hypothetical protein
MTIRHILPKVFMPRRSYNTVKLIPALVLLCFVWSGCSAWAANPQASGPSLWWQSDANGSYTISLYFFWTETCPHCQKARPYIKQLDQELHWLEVHSLPLSDSGNGQRYATLAHAAGGRAQSVPAFIFCGQMLTGYDHHEGIGEELRQRLVQCKTQLDQGLTGSPDTVADAGTTYVPGMGNVDVSQWSLPTAAVMLGLLDSFNPCAFFVLLFLLSLLVNAHSRARMLLIGGVFVVISGGVYFLFMTAWLNLFLIIGQLQWITLAAGALALVFGVLNIKDFFFANRGPSLSIPSHAKPGLFKRMRSLISAKQLTSMFIGTIVLAVLANSYELLCTAGFPMVFTRILTLNELPLSTYYAYLALYCFVYIVPLLTIVGAFAWTLGRRKLSEAEGRTLKLMSGLMMSGLGLMLITAPQLLNNLWYSAGLLIVVVTLSVLLHHIQQRTVA